MSGSKPVKCLVAGDVNGKFKQLINRVNAVIKKTGGFDVLFVVGEFFGPNDADNKQIVDGEIQFPLPTYILGPCCPSTSLCYPSESCELSSTVTYLGKKGILNLANSLMVGYMSGIEQGDENPGSLSDFEFDEKCIDDLLMPLSANSGFMGVDILLTSEWPTDVAKHSSNQPDKMVTGSKKISRLAAGLKPRYHFAGMGPHFERSPYRNHRVLLEPAQQVTRFIGLSSVDNSLKQKWLYAFSITPMRKLSKSEIVTQPDNSSEFPYMQILEEFFARRVEEERKAAEAQGSCQFFYDMSANPNEEDQVDRGGKRRKNDNDQFFGSEKRPREQNIKPDTCWFCLSNVGAEKHLIISIGTCCYSAMPKGPLNDHHLLVMSVAHVQSLVAASPEVRSEFNKFRDAYSLYCDTLDMALCVFERNYKTSHIQVQFVPVLKSNAKALRSTFLNLAAVKGIEFSFLKDDEQVWDLVGEGSAYFYVELPDGTRLLTRSMSRFPIQFGREVLASKAILDCEEKVDWRNCTLSKEGETALAQKLKAGFKPYDFTTADDSDED